MWLSCVTHTGLSFGGQPQDHHQNECNLGQPCYQVQYKTDGMSLQENIPTVKGKTTRQHPHKLVSDMVSIPHELHDTQHNVCLYIDIMYINGMPFLTTISKNIK